VKTKEKVVKLGKGDVLCPHCGGTGKVSRKPLEASVSKVRHERLGCDVYIVTLSERVDRSQWDSLAKEARARMGWWSRAFGPAPAGFAFREERLAKEFAKLV
jgi:hypothetical protein